MEIYPRVMVAGRVVVKIDGYGNMQWQKSFGGNSHEGAQSIQSTPGGGYIVGATTASGDGDVTGKHGDNFSHCRCSSG